MEEKYSLEYLKQTSKILPFEYIDFSFANNLKIDSSESEFIRIVKQSYLSSFFQNGKQVKDYVMYFDEKELLKIYKDTKFLMGEEIEIDDQHHFETLAKEVQINICQNNKDVRI